jgi:HEPN domain-containing protein
MEKPSFNKDKLIEYWSVSSDDDYDTMIVMFESKRFNWALFVGHLMIEKLLKALYVKNNNDYPPFIHNLLRLAEKCHIDLSDDQKLFFATVTAFNINARYDDYKMSFQQKCTLEYTAIWVKNLKNNRQWIKALIK